MKFVNYSDSDSDDESNDIENLNGSDDEFEYDDVEVEEDLIEQTPRKRKQLTYTRLVKLTQPSI